MIKIYLIFVRFLETMDPKECREQFLQELEIFNQQKKDFEEDMRKKNEAFAKREMNLIEKNQQETARLQEYAQRLETLEEV